MILDLGGGHMDGSYWENPQSCTHIWFGYKFSTCVLVSNKQCHSKESHVYLGQERASEEERERNLRGHTAQSPGVTFIPGMNYLGSWLQRKTSFLGLRSAVSAGRHPGFGDQEPLLLAATFAGGKYC